VELFELDIGLLKVDLTTNFFLLMLGLQLLLAPAFFLLV
jgi:hypothetical protein